MQNDNQSDKAKSLNSFTNEMFLTQAERILNHNKVFIHDLLNTTGAIKGLIECTKEASNMAEIIEIVEDIGDITNFMIEEIEYQKDFSAALDGRLKVNPLTFSLTDTIIKCVKGNRAYYSNIHWKLEEDIIIYSDQILVMRVLNNMIKNAWENAKMKTVTVTANVIEDYVEIIVNNKSRIPEHIQTSIFDTSISTKGSGHGFGTYSMKLLGEKYLKGYIHFQSKKEDGTTFVFGIPKK